MSRTPLIAASRRILCNVQNNMRDSALDVAGTGMTGSNINFKSILVQSPLTSASLFCSYIRNYVIRKDELPNTIVNRIFGLVHQKSPIWNTLDTSELKYSQMQESSTALKLALNGLRAKAAIQSRNHEAQMQFIDTQVKLNNMKKLIAAMNRPESSVYTSIYPCNTTSIEAPSMSPSMSNIASKNLHINGYKRILGVYIRISGPRRGNRKRVWRKSVGATSTTDPSSVVFEEAQAQLPSKIGTFGLKVKIVYSRKDRLINPNTKLPSTGKCSHDNNLLFGMIEPGMAPLSLMNDSTEKNLRRIFQEAIAS